MIDDAWLLDVLEGIDDFELYNGECENAMRDSVHDAPQLSISAVNELIPSPMDLAPTPSPLTTPTSNDPETKMSPLKLHAARISPVKRTYGRQTKTKNRSCSTPREEIIRLRQLVSDLEQRRIELTKRAREANRERVSSPESELSAALSSAWRCVAARQAKQRERAEMENVILRERLVTQIRLRDSIKRVLHRKQPIL